MIIYSIMIMQGSAMWRAGTRIEEGGHEDRIEGSWIGTPQHDAAKGVDSCRSRIAVSVSVSGQGVLGFGTAIGKRRNRYLWLALAPRGRCRKKRRGEQRSYKCWEDRIRQD